MSGLAEDGEAASLLEAANATVGAGETAQAISKKDVARRPKDRSVAGLLKSSRPLQHRHAMGMQWNALAATGICNSSTAHRRFQEWERAGVFQETWRQGLLDYDQAVGIDWSCLAADGARTKAPLGGQKTGPNPTDRGKRGRNAPS